jgi:methylmalonyl-CoA mutase
LHSAQQVAASEGIAKVQEAAVQNFNIFAELMETCKVASLGQVTNALFEVGGQYRRNM